VGSHRRGLQLRRATASSSRTEDIAKFGQLYLQKGQVERPAIAPRKKWVEAATSENRWTTTKRPAPGTRRLAARLRLPVLALPAQTPFRGDGRDGQICLVMPEKRRRPSPIHRAEPARCRRSWILSGKKTPARVPPGAAASRPPAEHEKLEQAHGQSDPRIQRRRATEAATAWRENDLQRLQLDVVTSARKTVAPRFCASRCRFRRSQSTSRPARERTGVSPMSATRRRS